MYEHLNTWTRDLGDSTSARLDLWDTGRVDLMGKSELRYALAFVPESLSERFVIVEGEDYRPSPLHAIDSDSAAAGLLGFMAYYGETSDEEATAGLTVAQLETLQRFSDELSLWGMDLEGEVS